MNTQQLAKDNCCFLIRSGSHLYGTDTPESDEDRVGIFIPNSEMLFGLHRADVVDDSIVDKAADGRNTKDAVDVTYYDIRKFAKLALQNNPNVLELLYAPEESILHQEPWFIEEFINYRHLFPHKGLVQKYIGYASSQKHKMVIRSGNYRELERGIDELESVEDKKQILIELPTEILTEAGLDRRGAFYQIGDQNMAKNITVQRALTMLHRRYSKFSNRKELVAKHGYDTKFASHLIRLLKQAFELLTYGYLRFPLPYKEEILEIKQGKRTIEEVMERATELEDLIKTLSICPRVREKPAYHEVNELVINLIRDHHG